MLPALHPRTAAPYTDHVTTTGSPLTPGHAPASTKLFEAVEDGNAAAVAALLSNAHIDVNAVHATTGHTVLMHAATTGHGPIVEALLHAGASANHAADDGMTALILAARHGYTSLVMLFLGQDAKIDAADQNGNTALMFAAMHNEADCAYALVDAGASITLRNHNGQNAVDVAADWLHTALAQQLPLRAAAREMHGSAARPATGIRLLQSGIRPPAVPVMPAMPDGAPHFSTLAGPDTPHSLFCAAARNGDGNTVKRMIQAGDGNLNTIDPATGLTALMLAAQHGHDDVVVMLCRGASFEDIQRVNAQGASALMLAAAAGHNDATELLLHKAATQQHKDQALAVAASNGQVASVQLLLTHGARGNQPDALGATPQHKAATLGRGAAIDALLAANANPAAIDHQGDNALAQALRHGHTDAGRRLQQALAAPTAQPAHTAPTQAAHMLVPIEIVKGPQVPNAEPATTAGTTTTISTIAARSPAPGAATAGAPVIQPAPTTLLDAVECNDAEALERMLQASAKADQATADRHTALQLAARLGHTAIVQALLQAGAKVDLGRRDDATALTWAALNGHTATLQALLQAGAKVDLARPDGTTALMWAALNGHTATVQALLQAGAKVDLARPDGMTSLMWAALNGRTATLQALLQAGSRVEQATSNGWTAPGACRGERPYRRRASAA